MAGSHRPGPLGLGDERTDGAVGEIGVLGGWAEAWPTGLEPGRPTGKQPEVAVRRLSFPLGATSYRVRRADVAAGVGADEERVPDAEARKVLEQLSAQGDGLGAHLRDLLRTGVPLVLLRVRPLTLTTVISLAPPIVPPSPQPAPARKPKEVKEGWIEIEVADEDGNLREGDRYQLKLPDGRVLEGTIGPNGTISLHGIDPGNAELSFPDIDGRAWE